MQTFDIIIVGAGPAGLIAGIMGAQSGARVLILDKKSTIGRPVKCAECIAADVFKGINIKPQSGWIASRVNRVEFHFPGGRTVHLHSPSEGYVLNRDIFEADLSEIAQQVGAIIRLSTPVVGLGKGGIVQTPNEQVKGGIIIGADGIRSYTGRCAGIQTRISQEDVGIGVQFLAHNHHFNNDCLSMFFHQKYTPRGYAWIFPKGGNSANVGLCTIGAGKINLLKLLLRFVHDTCPSDESAVLEKIINATLNKKRFLTASEWLKMKTRLTIGGFPASRPLPIVVKNNVALAGDAARLANPLTGGGLAAALVSGYYLGKLCGEIITTNAPYTRLQLYQRFLSRAMYGRLRTQYRLRKMIYDNRRSKKWLYRSLKLSSVLIRILPKSLLYAWLPKIKGF